MTLRGIPYASKSFPAEELLDETFADVGALGIVPCSVGGTNNAIILTPLTNTPTISALSNYLQFSFVAQSTSTGAVTLQVGSLAVLPVFAADGTTQLGSGSIQASDFYVVAYNLALNNGTGGWTVVTVSATGVTAGSYSGQVTFTADASGRITSATSSAPTVVQSTNFTSAGTFTFSTPSGTGITTVYKFTVVGGGGGGGGANAGAANGEGAGGGGGGGKAITWLSGATSGTSVTITVGGGGISGGGFLPSAGGTGGTSSVVFNGVTVSAFGGIGGSAGSNGTNVRGGAGGGALNAVVISSGAPGGPGIVISSSVTFGGQGGSSLFGAGAPGGASSGGTTGQFGGGGGGASAVSGGLNAGGGTGGVGIVLVEWIQ